jgi:N-acetylglucosamine kinase
VIISIDGGATKTCTLLFDEKAMKLISVGISGPSNFNTISEKVASSDISSTLSQIMGDEKIDRNAGMKIIAGLAGVGDSINSTEIGNRIIKSIFGDIPVRLENDGLLAYRMANLFFDGVVFAPGTGSVGFMQKNKELTRFGGWGWSMGGDEGSASWIGKEAIRVAQRQSDGIIEGDEFIKLVADHFGDNFRNIVGSLEREKDKRKVALLSPKVFSLAATGQKNALAIINEAADYDSMIINTVLKNFDYCPMVSVLGGTMKAGDIIQNRIISNIKCPVRFFFGYHVAIGGIILTLNDLGIPVNERIRDDIIKDLNKIINNKEPQMRMETLGF